MVYEVLFAGQLSWHPMLLAGIVGIALGYTYVVRRWTTVKMTHKQPLFFFSGLTILYITVGSPLSTMSQLFFSSHMVQMSILYFIVPPCLMLGIPERVFERIWKGVGHKIIGKGYLSATAALYVFAVLFLLYHVPFVFTVLAEHSTVQKGYLVVMFVLSFIMWRPITAPELEKRCCKGRKKRFAVLSSIVLLPACSLFILNGLIGTTNPFLSQLTTYLCIPPQSNVAELLPLSIDNRLDQFMGGVLMLGLHKVGLILTMRLGKTV